MIVVSRLRAIAVRMLLVVLGVLLALLAAEAVARVLGAPYGQNNFGYRCDRWVGWRGLSNASQTVSVDGREDLVTRNAAGMHDQAFDTAKSAGTFRILLLGDSFVEALQVDLLDTLQARLETTLGPAMPAGTRLEVIAAAAGGWGPPNELMYYRTEGKALRPDMVVVLWVPENDLSDILPESRLTHQGIDCYSPYFAVCDGAVDPGPWFSAPGIPPTWQQCSPVKKRLVSMLNHVYQVSRLYQRLEPFLSSYYHKREYANPYAPWLVSTKPDLALEYAYRLTDGIYGRLAEEAAQEGARTAFVIVPSKTALMVKLDPDYLDERQDGRIEAGGDAVDVTLSNRRFAFLMKRRELPTLDLFPAFLARLEAGQEPLYWETDTHWNETGNELAAQQISQWLISGGLVPTGENQTAPR